MHVDLDEGLAPVDAADLLLLQTLVVMQNVAPNGNASDVAKGQKMPLRRQHNVPMLASKNTCIQKFAS